MCFFIDCSSWRCNHIRIHLTAQRLRHVTTLDEVQTEGARIGSMSNTIGHSLVSWFRFTALVAICLDGFMI